MCTGELAPSLGPDAILDAFNRYDGRIIDLDRSMPIDATSLRKASDRLARGLLQAGLRPGDRVVVAISNGAQFIVGLTALLATGGSPIPTHAKTPPAELLRTAQRFGARFVATDAHAASDLVGSAAETEISCADWMSLAWGEFNTDGPAFETQFPLLPGVPLHLTSGTTGVPKVAVRPGPCAVAEAEHYIATIGVGPGDAILAAPPMSHAYGYGMCVMVPLVSGATIVSTREFSLKGVRDAVNTGELTIFPAVPGMIDALLFGAGQGLRSFPRKVFVAGAPLTERSATLFREKSGISIRPLYGTTETGGISVGLEVADELAIRRESHSVTGEQGGSFVGGCCVGPPMESIAVGCRSSITEHAADTPGTLHVRSSSMMAGYLGRDRIDTSALVDGWFDTCDVARVDRAGEIHLYGRRTEIINRGGLKIIPREVEEVLLLLPQVIDVKVYCNLRGPANDMIKAAVVTDGTLDASEMKAHCEEHLVYYKRPSRIICLDALPKTPSGKVILDKLP